MSRFLSFRTFLLLGWLLVLGLALGGLSACDDDNGGGGAADTGLDAVAGDLGADTAPGDSTVSPDGADDTGDAAGDAAADGDVEPLPDDVTADAGDVPLPGDVEPGDGEPGDVPVPTDADAATPDVPEPEDVEEELANVPDVVGCQVELRVRLNGVPWLAIPEGSDVEVTARLRNLTNATQTVVLVDQCPNGVAKFNGLTAGYDWYETCAAGACMPDLPPVIITLAPKEEKVIATALVNEKNDPCNEPLQHLTYAISFTLPYTGDPQPNMCGPQIPAELTIQ